MSSSDSLSLQIAYTPSGGASWTGGLTYQKNLVTALQEYAPHVKIYMLTEQVGKLSFQDDKSISVRYPPSASKFSSLVNRITQHFGYDFLLAKTLRSIPGGDVNLIFPGRFRAQKGVAVLNWIPDFQYIHLPEMYSRHQIEDLNDKFKQGIGNSTLVLLSSQDAYNDFQKFSPQTTHKARVMHFVAHIPKNLYEADLQGVIDQYHLPEKFIYLPNQFWKHKNHLIVFEAMRILNSKKVYPFVVCTGNPVDSRNPLYFAELIQRISEWNLRSQVAFLGLIPHSHVYMLIRQSICVINPSLFEGWSTTVEEAKSVGKRVLLSDLSVHREQNPPESVYFDPHDPTQLADILAEYWGGGQPGPDLELEQKARYDIPDRTKKFVETFVSIASEAVGMAQG